LSVKDWPTGLTAPTTVRLELVGNAGVFPSPLIASAQTLDRGGLKWQYTLNRNNLQDADRGPVMGLIASLRSQANRLRIEVFDNPKRGGYGGTPLVAGASQTGSVLNVDGVTNKTNWIRAGDYFSVDVGGDHELKMCTADANSSGGAVTINFEPRLRASPANNAAIFVEDGVLSVPEGIFMLANSTTGWSSKPHQSGQLADVQLVLIEDVFATQ
jgi:hypothetical protein